MRKKLNKFLPVLEEGYWRGLLLDAASSWSCWSAILYSSLFFTINHAFPTISVIASRNLAVWVYQFVVGLLMGVVYTKTRSLRWPVASHFLINLLSLSVAMFLGLYIPGQPK